MLDERTKREGAETDIVFLLVDLQLCALRNACAQPAQSVSRCTAARRARATLRPNYTLMKILLRAMK